MIARDCCTKPRTDIPPRTLILTTLVTVPFWVILGITIYMWVQP